ncbi:MAG TPA: PfkB family carbohydrate kinase, partial [Gammaproteobacteria bacterium]
MARIAVLGTLAVDRVVQLEAPLRLGAHQQGRALPDRCGGGGANAAVALARAGHQVALVSAVGDDADGRALLATLDAAGVDTAHVARLPQPTSNSLLLVDPQGERTIVNLQRLHAPHPGVLRELELDAVYVRSRASDLAPLLRALLPHRRVVAHVLVGSAADLAPGLLLDPFAHATRISGGQAEWIVATRGPQGASAYGRGETLQQPALPVTAVDSTGAGDAFAAGLVHALVHGETMAGCLAVAAAWGAAAVSQAGSLPGPG